MERQRVWFTISRCPVCWNDHPHEVTIPPVVELFVPHDLENAGLRRDLTLICPITGKSFEHTIIYHRPGRKLQVCDAYVWPFAYEDARYVSDEEDFQIRLQLDEVTAEELNEWLPI
jgi:hypothetical protein